jgi:hypothetical protein
MIRRSIPVGVTGTVTTVATVVVNVTGTLPDMLTASPTSDDVVVMTAAEVVVEF